MIQRLLNIAKKRKYKIFTRPYELNIWGERSDSVEAGKFDDVIYCFWYNEKGKLEDVKFKVSTDPATFWLQNPMQSLGAAILKQGQYLDTWQAEYNTRLGFYALELVQRLKMVSIIRDYNRDAILDFLNGTVTVGFYGINIHVGANPNQVSIDVGRWSAGCQVFASWAEYQVFTKLVERHWKIYGNKFSYTLVDKRATARANRRLILNASLAIAGGLGLGYYAYKKLTKAAA